MTRQCVVVFAKVPRLGAVKTRLARDVGAVAAWRFYREASFSLLHELSADRRWSLRLDVTPDAGVAWRGWPRDVARRAQGPGDLGRRMRRALRAAGAGPVVLVGSDIPQLRRRHIVRAFAALARADVVFGPANDGGFWLVGVRRPALASGLFADVRWSTPHALADSLAGLPAACRVELVDVLVDVDSAADLRLLAPAARPAGAGSQRRG